MVTALDAASFGAWEAGQFAPEQSVLAKLTAIEGVTKVETQTYTLRDRVSMLRTLRYAGGGAAGNRRVL